MVIDLLQLQTFVAVAEEQHLKRAAERLHISQSAASFHVREIEKSLDVQLFARTNRSLELTRAGELLLQEARVLLNQATVFTSFARQLRGRIEGRLTLGSNTESSESRLGDVVAALHASHPLVRIDLRSRPSAGTRDGLKTGELDIGVLLGPPNDPGFVYCELTTVQFRIAGPAAWRDRIAQANLAELAGLPWLTPNDSGLAYAAVLDELFTRRGLKLNSVLRYDSGALARAMMPTGIGLTLMRAERAAQGERAGFLAISPILPPELGLSFAFLASRAADPLVRAFVEAARSAWPQMRMTSPLSG